MFRPHYFIGDNSFFKIIFTGQRDGQRIDTSRRMWRKTWGNKIRIWRLLSTDCIEWRRIIMETKACQELCTPYKENYIIDQYLRILWWKLIDLIHKLNKFCIPLIDFLDLYIWLYYLRWNSNNDCTILTLVNSKNGHQSPYSQSYQRSNTPRHKRFGRKLNNLTIITSV